MSIVEADRPAEARDGEVQPAEGSTARSRKTLVLDTISFLARFIMAAVWIQGGVTKLNNHMTVAQNIEAYQIFTPEWSSFLAQLIGPLEIAGGVMLLLGLFLRTSSIVSIVVLVLFIIGIAQAWSRGLILECGCFGSTGISDDVQRDYLMTIIRDIFFIALSAWTIWRPFKKWSIYTP